MTSTEQEQTASKTAMTTLLHNQENMSGQSRDAMGLMHKEGALINIVTRFMSTLNERKTYKDTSVWSSRMM
jgi:hypothetical protein